MTTSDRRSRPPTIAVYGASGFTGSLVVAELVRRGIDTVLVGRDSARLEIVARANGTPSHAVRVAGLDDPSVLAAAFGGVNVVINAAGPFGRTVDAVVAAAIEAGAHYVDTSGEQAPTKQIFDTFADAASAAGVSVVPGTADDGLPTNLAAQLAADQLAAVDEVTIAVRIVSAVTRGSVRSLHDAMSHPTLDFEDGAWKPAIERSATITFPGDDTPTQLGTFPLPAVVTVPRHIAARRVSGLIDDETIGALRAIRREEVETMPEVLSAEARRSARWQIVVDASAGSGHAVRAWVRGPDGYLLTSVIAVEAALRVAAGGAPAGVLAAAQAFDPAGFLDALAAHGVEWGVEAPVAARSAS